MHLAHCVGCRPSLRAERRFDQSILPQSCLSLAVLDNAVGDQQEAVARERQIKGWAAAKKLALAQGRLADLKRLAAARRGSHRSGFDSSKVVRA